jgi:hypothetical protein
LKTFLTQIGFILPLTPDPPVICFWKWIRWKDYELPKNRNLENVSAKNEIFFSPTPQVPTLCTRRSRVSLPRLCPQPHTTKEKSSSLPKKLPQPCILGALSRSGRCHHLHLVPPPVRPASREGNDMEGPVRGKGVTP